MFCDGLLGLDCGLVGNAKQSIPGTQQMKIHLCMRNDRFWEISKMY